MSEDQNRNERLYLLTMNLAKTLLTQGTISKELYLRYDRKMQEKYSPTYSKLFTDIMLESA